MKNKLILVAAALLISTSAHAIDEKYRQKLERSGCTQVSEMEGCDINKTKAENAKAGFVNEAPAQQQPAGISSRASGDIPCAMGKGKALVQCPFTVERQGQGSAIVSITLPDGRKRAIFFEKGKATGADLSQADGDMTFKASKKSDVFYIQAGKERYEIFEAVVFGG